MMIRCTRSALFVSATVIAMMAARPAIAHPLHTSLAELTEKRGGDFSISLRVFADDFLRHTGVPETAATAARPDPRIVGYLVRTFVIIDKSGRGLPLKWCGSKRVADLLVICLSGRMGGGVTGARVRYSVLTDLFPDQVNVLQIAGITKRQSLLFTPAEATRLIR